MPDNAILFPNHFAMAQAILAAGFVYDPSFGYVLRIFGMEWSTAFHHLPDGQVGLVLWQVGV